VMSMLAAINDKGRKLFESESTERWNVKLMREVYIDVGLYNRL